jgi:uncharacterized protein (DUF58 family)
LPTLRRPSSALPTPAQRFLNAAKYVLVKLLEGPRHIRPTLEGVVFILVTLVVGFAAMNTAAQLLYIMFSLMCGFLVLSAISANANYRGISISRYAPRVVEAQRATAVRVTAQSRKKFVTSFSLQIFDSLAVGRLLGAVFIDRVPPKGEVSRDYLVVFPRRGIVRLGELSLHTRFPFSLIERRSWRDAKAEILVLPQVIDVSSLMREIRADLGEIEINRRGRGAGLYNIREHERGDSSRDIHWKVSARRGRLMVREYEAEEHRKASVILDNRCADIDDPESKADFERAVILASSVLAHICRDGHQVELRTGAGVVNFGTGDLHLLRCRRALASIKPVPADDPIAKRYLTRSGESSVTLFVAWGDRYTQATQGVVAVATSTLREQLDASLDGKSIPMVSGPVPVALA